MAGTYYDNIPGQASVEEDDREDEVERDNDLQDEHTNAHDLVHIPPRFLPPGYPANFRVHRSFFDRANFDPKIRDPVGQSLFTPFLAANPAERPAAQDDRAEGLPPADPSALASGPVEPVAAAAASHNAENENKPSKEDGDMTEPERGGDTTESEDIYGVSDDDDDDAALAPTAAPAAASTAPATATGNAAAPRRGNAAAVRRRRRMPRLRAAARVEETPGHRHPRAPAPAPIPLRQMRRAGEDSLRRQSRPVPAPSTDPSVPNRDNAGSNHANAGSSARRNGATTYPPLDDRAGSRLSAAAAGVEARVRGRGEAAQKEEEPDLAPRVLDGDLFDVYAANRAHDLFEL
ncbi:hypothetical protein F4780DRAFT_787035 [Xylariomycetidae sp. FL0641]|nr:hypothetical protein F4780DRAFT_787035 [Xylariomycetidae sp. FL0641]